MTDDSEMVMVPRGKLKAWADTLYDQAWSLNDRAVGDVSKEIEHVLSAPSTTTPAEQAGTKPVGEQIVLGNDWQRRMLDHFFGEDF